MKRSVGIFTVIIAVAPLFAQTSLDGLREGGRLSAGALRTMNSGSLESGSEGARKAFEAGMTARKGPSSEPVRAAGWAQTQGSSHLGKASQAGLRAALVPEPVQAAEGRMKGKGEMFGELVGKVGGTLVGLSGGIPTGMWVGGGAMAVVALLTESALIALASGVVVGAATAGGIIYGGYWAGKKAGGWFGREIDKIRAAP
jgi:hypothetical protein